MADEPKKNRGEAAREVIGAVEILPPDPKPPGADIHEPKRAKGVLTAFDGKLTQTPGVRAFLEGRNPRAIRRRILAKIRDMSDDAAETLEKLIMDGRDTRVQLQAVSIALAYTAGKPGEGAADPGATESGGTIDIMLLSDAEQDELNAALNVIARLRGVAAARAQ